MLTPDQAQAALASGLLNQDTFNKIMAAQPQMTQAPVAEVPIVEQPIVETPGRNDVDWSKVQERLPEGGVLRQAVQDEARQRMNFRNAQLPSPLMAPSEPIVEQPAQELVQEQIPVVEPSAQVAADPDRTKIAQEVQTGLEEGAFQAAKAKGMQDSQDSYEQRIRDIQKQKEDARQKAIIDEQKSDAEIDKIQPKDFWADKSTGTKIAAAIATALGAYGAGITGGPNQASQIIDAAVQRDLSLQKEKYQRAKDRRANIKTALGDQLALLGDQEAAEASLQANAYKKAEMKIRQAEARAQSDIQKLNAQKLIAEIQGKQAEALQKRQEILTQMQLRKGGSNINAELLPEKQRERFVDDPEFRGVARTKEEAIKFREGLASYKDTIGSLNRLHEITNMSGKSVSPELRAEVQQLRSLLTGTLREDVLGPGTMTAEERGIILNDVLGNPSGITNLDSATKVKIRNLTQKVQSKKLEQAKAIGLNAQITPTEANAVIVRTPDGKTTRIARSSLAEAQRRAKAAGVALEVLDGLK